MVQGPLLSELTLIKVAFNITVFCINVSVVCVFKWPSVSTSTLAAVSRTGSVYGWWRMLRELASSSLETPL